MGSIGNNGKYGGVSGGVFSKSLEDYFFKRGMFFFIREVF